MKIYPLFCFLFIITNSQIKFEKGYIVPNNEQRKEVYIKNMDWSDNPETFVYKLSETGEERIGNINSIKEFGAENYFKFVRYTGKIDISSNHIDELSNTKDPIWEERTVFLNQLVSGKINLYQYTGKNIEQFFYSQQEGNITPLVYKKYNPDSDRYKIAENTKYINQLKDIFSENKPSNFNPDKIIYEKRNFIKVFEEYNGTKTDVKNNRVDFNLSVRPGISFLKLNLDTHSANQVEFPNKTAFRIGIETELVLPFNKNKWALVAEPFYYRYKNENLSKDGNYKFYTNFDNIDMELALRHYMFLNSNSKIYINAGFVANLYITKDAQISYNNLMSNYSGRSFFDTKGGYFNFGIGYNYRNKFSGEFKLSTAKELYERGLWNADFNQMSFIFGYNIF